MLLFLTPNMAAVTSRANQQLAGQDIATSYSRCLISHLQLSFLPKFVLIIKDEFISSSIKTFTRNSVIFGISLEFKEIIH